MNHRQPLNVCAPRNFILFFTCLITISANAYGQVADADYSLFLGALYSDNMTRQSLDEVDEVAAEVGGTIDVARESSHLSLSVVADGSFREYTENTYEDEFLGGLSGRANILFSPERFEWLIADEFGQTQVDLGRPLTPENRGDYNNFSSGPTLSLPFGSVTSLNISAIFHDVWYEERDDDYDRTDINVGIQRSISKNRSAGIFASTSDVKYKVGESRDAEIRSAYFQLNSRSSRSTLSLDLGYNEIEGAFVAGDGQLIHFKFTRQLSSKTTLELGANQAFAASGDVLRRGRTLPGVGVDDTLVDGEQNQPVEMTDGSIGVRYESGRYVFAIGGSVTREESTVEGTTQVRDRQYYNASITRTLGQSASIELSANFDEDELDSATDPIERSSYGFHFTYQLSPRVQIMLSALAFSGDGGDSRPDYDFDENQVSLRLSFSPR